MEPVPCADAAPRGLLHSKQTNREYDPLPRAMKRLVNGPDDQVLSAVPPGDP
jgi:hypothetical protein